MTHWCHLCSFSKQTCIAHCHIIRVKIFWKSKSPFRVYSPLLPSWDSLKSNIHTHAHTEALGGSTYLSHHISVHLNKLKCKWKLNILKNKWCESWSVQGCYWALFSVVIWMFTDENVITLKLLSDLISSQCSPCLSVHLLNRTKCFNLVLGLTFRLILWLGRFKLCGWVKTFLGANFSPRMIQLLQFSITVCLSTFILWIMMQKIKILRTWYIAACNDHRNESSLFWHINARC